MFVNIFVQLLSMLQQNTLKVPIGRVCLLLKTVEQLPHQRMTLKTGWPVLGKPKIGFFFAPSRERKKIDRCTQLLSLANFNRCWERDKEGRKTAWIHQEREKPQREKEEQFLQPTSFFKQMEGRGVNRGPGCKYRGWQIVDTRVKWRRRRRRGG